MVLLYLVISPLFSYCAMDVRKKPGICHSFNYLAVHVLPGNVLVMLTNYIIKAGFKYLNGNTWTMWVHYVVKLHFSASPESAEVLYLPQGAE